MTIRHLDYFFAPESVTLIGASPKPQSLGALIYANLRRGYAGKVYPVNPRYDSLFEQPCYPTVAALPRTPDLAILCTPAASLPGLIDQLGAKGCKAAIVITGGVNSTSLSQQLLDAARPHMLRIIGPNCLGVLVPKVSLNASFAHIDPLPGRLAFVSQSGALATAVLDWSLARGIGFSSFITVGDALDVDMGDLLDYLASDADTQAILLYMESIKHARKFMSAARAAARAKPVIAVKSGRAEAASRAVQSHTGAMAGSDDVVDCTLRRAGILRVDTLQDLFDAAQTLARAKPLTGDRLVILTNGGGAGVLATDALMHAGGTLAPLSSTTMRELETALPSTWSRANPVDIIGDAPAQRYVQALEVLAREPDADAVLLMHAPTAIVPSLEIAHQCLPVIQQCRKPVLTCWLGEHAVQAARRAFAEASVPGYDTPEEAVRAFLHLRDYRRNQELLMQTPPHARDVAIDHARVREVLNSALAQGRQWLSEPEAKSILSAYGIAVVPTRVAIDADDAVRQADALGYPAVLKILSSGITHKSDVGGVALRLADADDLRLAARRMLAHVKALAPNAAIEGFSVQPMLAPMSGQHELILGCAQDPVFGPVILFGHGGTAAELLHDRAMALPPLNALLAAELIQRTRVSRLLAGYRDQPPVAMDALIDTLLKLSRLICDQDQIMELDINPLIAHRDGVVALDARIRIAASGRAAPLAILPYPEHLAESMLLGERPITLRPIRAEDENMHKAFLESLTPEDVHLRFFYTTRSWNHHQLARFTQIDYDREMAFVAVTNEANPRTLGVARAIADPDNTRAEFAIVVRSDLKGQGLGGLLMRKLIAYQRTRGTQEMVGEVLSSNTAMLKLARHLGFSATHSTTAGTTHLSLNLNPS